MGGQIFRKIENDPLLSTIRHVRVMPFLGLFRLAFEKTVILETFEFVWSKNQNFVQK